MTASASVAAPICLRLLDGTVHHSGVEWLAPATAEETEILRRVRGPVLDIGCGPGRHVTALEELGIPALGIDVTPGALATARRRGVPVLERSIFDRVPGAGRWGAALLLDGNLGIGGDPILLLRRISRLVRPGGTILVELRSAVAPEAQRTVRLEIDGRPGPWFRWAQVGIDELEPLATSAALVVTDRWCVRDRWFATLKTGAQ